VSSPYTGNAGHIVTPSPVTITVPSDGDDATAASVNTPGPFEGVADYLAWFLANAAILGNANAFASSQSSPLISLANAGSGFALQVGAGNQKMSASNPVSTTGFSNVLTPKNVPKAWVHLTTDGVGGVVVDDGFNISSAAISGVSIILTFATPMGNTHYCLVPGIDSSTPFFPWYPARNVGSVQISAKNTSSGTFDLSANAVGFQVAVFGAQ
jgi:hypothetical protein